MRKSRSSPPVSSFNVPPSPPKPVAEQLAAFDSISTKYAEHLGRIQDAEAAVEAAKAADHRALLAAIDAGEDLPHPTKEQEQATARLAALNAAVPALAESVDAAGNRLADAIAEHADAWAETLAAEADKTERRYHAAVAKARDALDDLGRGRSSISWLQHFDVGDARIGRVRPWLGKPEPTSVSVRDPRGRDHRVDELLGLAASLGRTQEPATNPMATRRFATRPSEQVTS